MRLSSYENILTRKSFNDKTFEEQAVLKSVLSWTCVLCVITRVLLWKELQRVCCIHGHHVYKEVLEAAVGEVLCCSMIVTQY